MGFIPILKSLTAFNSQISFMDISDDRQFADDSVKNGIIPAQPFAKNKEGALALHKDVLLYVIIALGVVATTFTLVWGIIR